MPIKEEEHTEETDEYARIESIRVYVDGFMCNVCGRTVHTDLMKEEGIESLVTDTGLGLIEIVPKAGETFDLHGLRQRINAMRDYVVIKMDVVASGEVQEVSFVDHIRTFHSRPHSHKRYRLMAGEFNGFVLAENEKLKEVLRSADKNVTVVGTITAFRGKMPILHIRDYQKIEKQPHS